MRRVLCLFAFFLCLSGEAQAEVFRPEVFTLANGLQIIVVPSSLSAAVSQMVWYKVGSADEEISGTGLAHYLEHLMFRGTPARPAGAFSRTIAGEGGTDNAFTSRDATAYYENVAADRLPLIMAMEADRMANLQIDPDTAKTELDVVLSERQERTDNDPYGPFWEKLGLTLFPRHPYGNPVIGWKEKLEKITPEAARRFYEKHYAPNNAVVVISGNVTSSEVLRLAAGTFGHVPAREVATRPDLPMPEAPLEKRLVMRDARLKQAHVGLHCVAPSYQVGGKKEALALEVLAEVLAGGEVGILYQNLVLRRRSASGVQASYDPWERGPAQFSLIAVPSPTGNAEQMEKALLVEIDFLAKQGLSNQAIKAAKRRLQRSAIFARDSLTAAGQTFGAALTTGGSVEDVEAWPERIRAVRTTEVQAAWRKIASRKACVIAILTPEGEGK